MYVIMKFRGAANILSVRCDTFKAGEDIFRDIHDSSSILVQRYAIFIYIYVCVCVHIWNISYT